MTFDVVTRLLTTDALPEGTNTEVSKFARNWWDSLDEVDRSDYLLTSRDEGAERIEGIMVVSIGAENVRSRWAMWNMEMGTD